MIQPPQPDFDHLSLREIGATLSGSLFMGVTRFLYLLRRGRKFKWFDLIAEPCFAVTAGMLVWLLCEATGVPDLIQLLMSQLGAWGGPKTIQVLELRYFSENFDKRPKGPDTTS